MIQSNIKHTTRQSVKDGSRLVHGMLYNGRTHSNGLCPTAESLSATERTWPL